MVKHTEVQYTAICPSASSRQQSL